MSDTTTTTEQPSTPAPKPPLTRELVAQMVDAMQTVIRISNKSIKEPNDEAELSGQRQFLARTFITYAGEFIGCWLAVTDEYTPLVNGFSALLQRAAIATAHRHAAQQAAAEPAPTASEDASKIVAFPDGTKKE